MFFKKLVFFAFFIISGCGFSPLYKNNITKQAHTIYIAPIKNYEGFLLRTKLQQNLIPADNSHEALYTLTVKLDAPVFTDVNIQNDNFASREKIYIKAHYTLTDQQTGKTLLSSSTGANGAFNIIENPYAVQITEGKQTENIIEMIGNTITLQIMAYFNKMAGENES